MPVKSPGGDRQGVSKKCLERGRVVHRVWPSAREGLPDHPEPMATHDAPQDYPQSRRTAKVLRLWHDPLGLGGEQLAIEVPIKPRANSRPICSGCRRKGPGYDRLPPRRFEFVPLWQIAVFFVYAMRRVDCPRCGVTVEQVPWGEGKCTLTTSFRWFLAAGQNGFAGRKSPMPFGRAPVRSTHDSRNGPIYRPSSCQRHWQCWLIPDILAAGRVTNRLDGDERSVPLVHFQPVVRGASRP